MKPRIRIKRKHMESQSPTKQLHTKHVSKILIVLIGILLVVLIAGGYMYWRMVKITPVVAPKTPLEELQELEASSKPVTTTTAQRIADLQQLQKSSKPVKTSRDEQLTALQALEKSSQ
jgi:Tfp pilus assembly protein PilN